MSLTPAQLQTLKTDIDTNSGPGGDFEQWVGDLSKEANQAIADIYNSTVSPDWWVWKLRLLEQDIYTMVSDIATTWDWTFFANMNAGEQTAWDKMLSGGSEAEPFINLNLPQVRQGIDDIFTGPQGGQATNNHIKAVGRELGSRGHKVLTTNGNGTTTVPADTPYEGVITQQEISNARRL